MLIFVKIINRKFEENEVLSDLIGIYRNDLDLVYYVEEFWEC